MKRLSAVVLCSLFAIVFPNEDGYPPEIKIERDILVFLTEYERAFSASSEVSFFCNAALITDFLIVAANTCLVDMIRNNKEIFALIGSKVYLHRRRIRIVGKREETSGLRLLTLSSSAPFKKKEYVAGLTALCGISIKESDELVLYGYMHPEKSTFAKLTLDSPNENSQPYYTFTIESEDYKKNWKGSPVFYNRVFVAICDNANQGNRITCLKINPILSFV